MRPYKNMSKFWFNILATANACLGFTFFGYNITISNNVGPYTYLNVFPHYGSFLNTLLWASPMITAAIGTLIAGTLALKVGRRRIMIVADVIGICGVIMTIFPVWVVILIGRLLEGITIGITSVAASLYFTEITPPEYRGELTNGPTVFAAIGILIATLLNLIVPDGTLPRYQTDDSWRPLLAFGMIPAILRILGFTFIFRYETPYYYINKRKYAKAARCLLDFYNGDIVERIREIIRERNYVQKDGQVKIWQLFSKKFTKAVFASVIMFSLQYLSGFNLILAFTGRIYSIGVSSTSRHNWLPGLLGVTTSTVNLLAALTSIWTTSRFGRRPLVVYGVFFTGLCLLLYGILAVVVGPGSLAAKIFLVLWPIPWNLSLGSVINVITAETLPDIGVSVSVCVGWIFGYLTFQFYPKERDSLGRGYTFIMYAIIVIVGSIILWFIVIETRGKNKDQILKEYSGKYKSKEAIEGEVAAAAIAGVAVATVDEMPDDVYRVLEKDEEKRKKRMGVNYIPQPYAGRQGADVEAPENNCDTCHPHRKYLKFFRRNHFSKKRIQNEVNVQRQQDAIEQVEVLHPEEIAQIEQVEEKYERKQEEEELCLDNPREHVREEDMMREEELRGQEGQIPIDIRSINLQ